MRTLLGFFAISVFGALALFYVIATVLIQLLPVLVIAAVAVVVCQAATRRRRALGSPASTPPAAAQVAHRRGGWVYLPVWVPATAPPPVRPFIDAEVIDVRSD